MQFVYLSLLAVALVVVQCMIGGTRLIYAFPAYAMIGLAAALSIVSIRRPAVKPSPWCLASAILLAGYVAARAWFSPNPYLALTDAYMVVACLLVYLMVALYLPQSRSRNWIIGALLLVAVIHTTVGALQFKDGEFFMLFGFNRGGAYGSRASGMLICPNHLAGFLEAVGLMALSITIWSRYRLPIKLITGYVALFCFLGVAISGSRGGYISSTFGLIAFVALSLWIIRIFQRRFFVLSAIGSVMVLAIALGLAVHGMRSSQVINKRLHQISTASEDMRWYNWLATIDQFKLSPVIGTGSGTHLYYGRLFRRPELQADPEHSHGDYLELLAEYGIVGEALAVLFLVVHIGRGLATVRQITMRGVGAPFGLVHSNTLALTVGALSAVAALLAHSVVDFNMHIPGNALLFAALFALLGSPGLAKPAEDHAGIPETLLRGLFALTGVALLAGIVLQYKGEHLDNQARKALEKNELQKCIDFTELGIEQNPSNPNLYFYQGEAYRAQGANMTNYGLREGYFEQAIAAYRKGLEHFPQNENLWIRLGQCLDATFQLDEAEEAYLHAIANDPSLGILYAYYAAHLRLTGDLEGAEECDTAARKMCGVGSEKIGMSEPPSLFLMHANPAGIP